MGLKTLAQMCTDVAINNLHSVWDIGDLPYHACRNILKKIVNPDHLRAIIEASPNLLEDSAELWKFFIDRDFYQLAQKIHLEPQSPNDYCSLYYEYRKIETANLAEDLKRLKQGMKTIQQEKDARTVQLASSREVPKPARSSFRNTGGRFFGPSKYGGKTTGQIGLMKVLQKGRQARHMNRITHTPQVTVGPSRGIATRRLERLSNPPPGLSRQVEIENRQNAIIKAPRKPINLTSNPCAFSREERLRRIKEGKVAQPCPSQSSVVDLAPLPARSTKAQMQKQDNIARPPIRRGLLAFNGNISQVGTVRRIPAVIPKDADDSGAVVASLASNAGYLIGCPSANRLSPPQSHPYPSAASSPLSRSLGNLGALSPPSSNAGSPPSSGPEAQQQQKVLSTQAYKKRKAVTSALMPIKRPRKSC